jgi:hypothetical protein
MPAGHEAIQKHAKYLWDVTWHWLLHSHCADMMWSWFLPALGLVTAVLGQTTTTTTTVQCPNLLYNGPQLGKKAVNTHRISITKDVDVGPCLDVCTATNACVGVSHDVGGNFALELALWHLLRVLPIQGDLQCGPVAQRLFLTKIRCWATPTRIWRPP